MQKLNGRMFQEPELKDALQLLIPPSLNVTAEEGRRMQSRIFAEKGGGKKRIFLDAAWLFQLLLQLFGSHSGGGSLSVIYSTGSAWIISLNIFNFFFFFVIMHQNLR